MHASFPFLSPLFFIPFTPSLSLNEIFILLLKKLFSLTRIKFVTLSFTSLTTLTVWPYFNGIFLKLLLHPKYLSLYTASVITQFLDYNQNLLQMDSHLFKIQCCCSDAYIQSHISHTEKVGISLPPCIDFLFHQSNHGPCQPLEFPLLFQAELWTFC